MCVGRCGVSTYGFNGLRKGDEHTVHILLSRMATLTFFYRLDALPVAQQMVVGL